MILQKKHKLLKNFLVVEFHYRHKLAHLTDGLIEPDVKTHPLGLESAYKCELPNLFFYLDSNFTQISPTQTFFDTKPTKASTKRTITCGRVGHCRIRFSNTLHLTLPRCGLFRTFSSKIWNSGIGAKLKLPFQFPPFPPGLVIALAFPAYSELLSVWSKSRLF